MGDHTTGVPPRPAAPSRLSGDSGAATSLSIALLTPIFIVLAFAAVQAALWSHAKTEARVIARDTAALVARSGVAAGDAQSSASAILAADTTLSDVTVGVTPEPRHRRRHGVGQRAGHHPWHLVVVLRDRGGPRRGAHPTVTRPEPRLRPRVERCARCGTDRCRPRSGWRS